MKIMAIDYGDAHTGVAFSDPTGFLTGTTTTIHSRSADVVLSELARLAKEQGAEEIVMGFPRNMDGTEGPRAELYRAFAGRVEEATGLKPVLWDERRWRSFCAAAPPCPSFSGTSGAPPWTPTAFYSRRARTPKSARRR